MALAPAPFVVVKGAGPTGSSIIVLPLVKGIEMGGSRRNADGGGWWRLHQRAQKLSGGTRERRWRRLYDLEDKLL